jgi:predicted enzyme involved in methoxymalonyl-ACP biosynthesis
VSYTDKFGPLGKIAVVAGRRNTTAPAVNIWVMSCRAFSRRIEHHVVSSLYAELAASALDLAYRPTAKNKPLQAFLGTLAPNLNGAQTLRVSAAGFAAELPHHVEIEK